MEAVPPSSRRALPVGIEAHSGAGAAIVRQPKQRINTVIFRHEPELSIRPVTKMPDALGQSTRQVLNSDHICITTHFKRSDFPWLFIGGGIGQHMRQVGKKTGHGWPLQTTRQVAVLTVRRAPFGQVHLPVGGGRYGL